MGGRGWPDADATAAITIDNHLEPFRVRLLYASAPISSCMPPLSSPSLSPATAPRAKSTLFCPDCGHESPADGDWDYRASDRGATTHCPDCGARIADRPTDPQVTPTALAPSTRHLPSSRHQSSASDDTDADVDAHARTLLGRWVRVALAWTAWPCTATPERSAARTQ